MARVATKNTYGTEMVGGVEVRRLVVAGDPVPDHYNVDSDAVREIESTEPGGRVGQGVSEAIVQPGDDGGEQLEGDALNNRAKELDIKGRSNMTADELRAAIADAEAQ